MTTTQPLLFELGCEELPPKTLLKLSNALLEGIIEGLKAANLSFTASKAYATPRRLAVLIDSLQTAQPDKTVEKRGPAMSAAFAPDGSPSKAALGFAHSCGTPFDQLQRLQTDKGEWLSYTQAVTGQRTEAVIPDIIRAAIAALPIAKRMRWGSFATEFVRPVHWAVLLFGDQVIETEILGLTTGNTSYGHRFHAPDAIVINRPHDYAAALFGPGHVIADLEQRKTLIRAKAEEAAATVGGIVPIEADLLEEIAALNEWPMPIIGNFDPRFLALPKEVLITTLQTHQKYFPVEGADGSLLAHFITFSNIASKRPEVIRQGNERVVTPRLADAEFFWNQDRKQPLAAHIETLKTVLFQEKLGTVYDKAVRVSQLSAYIAERVGADVNWARRAAMLAKTDLLTTMVGEFGNLQGIMGRYYALAEGEVPAVAWALEEQYFPKQSGSATAPSALGQVLAIAEKIDTLAGIFSTGLVPTGDKDPYALRRAALGTLRTLIENGLSLDIPELCTFALAQFSHSFEPAATHTAVVEFIFERLRGYCLDKGYTADAFESVMSLAPADPLDFMQRLAAVQAFRRLPEAESLASANKRIRNLLKKAESAPAETVGVLVEPQEIALLAAARQAAQDIKPLLAERNYHATLNRLAGLRETVDAFFDHVRVMTDDLELRANRLALLNLLSEQFLTCADISKLQS